MSLKEPPPYAPCWTLPLAQMGVHVGNQSCIAVPTTHKSKTLSANPMSVRRRADMRARARSYPTRSGPLGAIY